MKTFTELQAECQAVGIVVEVKGRRDKSPFIAALREYHWRKEHPEKPLPPQIAPMLLQNWGDLDADAAAALEHDQHEWCVEPKLDGVRTLFHIDADGIRVTGRHASDVNYRLCEYQEQVPHLSEGLNHLAGTILDGEILSPKEEIDTGTTRTGAALQAVAAILNSKPEKAKLIQQQHGAWLQVHVFDVLKHKGADSTKLPLRERQVILHDVFSKMNNPHIRHVPNAVVGKPNVHRRILDGDGEGTVWKRLDSVYQPGKRSPCWLKRKRAIQVVASISGFLPGSHGHSNQVGAIEFSSQQPDGVMRPVGWVSVWTDEERRTMTHGTSDGSRCLNPTYLGRRAVIAGQGWSAKSRRLRHARFVRWLDS